MKKYKLKQPVNWERVLRAMRRRIQAHQRIIERCYEDIMRDPSTGKYLCWELKENLEAYQALRKFLRYSAPTKIEKEAGDLLRSLPAVDETKPTS